jgi:surface antigen
MTIFRRLTIGIAAVFALTLAPHASQAQMFLGSRLGEVYFKGEDTKIIEKLAGEMLRNAPDGESRSWSNPATSNGGELTVIRSYQARGLPCRDMRVSSRIGDRSIVYALSACRTAAGRWKIAH